MADIEKLIPHVLKWECGVARKGGESLEALFERCRRVGYAEVPGDAGGPTMCGVTLATFREWRGHNDCKVADLKQITFAEWLEIMKHKFWDACRADRIASQGVADMLVDWRWVNGLQAVRDAQTALGLVPDGIVGPKTLEALNTAAPEVFTILKNARLRSYRKIVERRPSQKKFYRGWVNRTEEIEN